MYASYFPDEISAVIALTRGDENALTYLFKKYSSKLFMYSFRFLKTKDLSDEVVQEAFLRIWHSRENLDPDQQFNSFLFKITKNLIIDVLRKAAKEKSLQKEIAGTMKLFHNHIEEEIIYEELIAISQRAIEGMPNQQRLVYDLSREKGLSYDQISEQLGISINTVKVHMSNSLKSIRLHMKENADLLSWLVFVCVTLR